MIPNLCESLFSQIDQDKAPNLKYQVKVSMIEIYNERVQDLLIPVNQRLIGGLKIRESQSYGVYVEGLTKIPVDSYEQIEKIMMQGNKNRSIAATRMNAVSSRAHTIFSIELKQILIQQSLATEKHSTIHLVDLAGSEKVYKTGSVGDRLKEGCQINKSLSLLGNVINKLAHNSQNPQKPIFIPYRDSQLTRILQNALGGNSKTFMLCAISPSCGDYLESLSTLVILSHQRYAETAKKIKCEAKINQNETDQIIQNLKQENELLQAKLAQNNSNQSTQQKQQEIDFLQKTLDINQQLMVELEQDYQKQLQDYKDKLKSLEDKQDGFPYLENLNEDSQLNGKVKYSLKLGKIQIGSNDETNEIVLGGYGIQPQHAQINFEIDHYRVRRTNDHYLGFVFVNGKNIQSDQNLEENDRIAFGSQFFFMQIFYHSLKYPNSQNHKNFTWQDAQNELQMQNKDMRKYQIQATTFQWQQQMEDRLKDLEEEYQLEQQRKEFLIKMQKTTYSRRIRALEDKISEVFSQISKIVKQSQFLKIYEILKMLWNSRNFFKYLKLNLNIKMFHIIETFYKNQIQQLLKILILLLIINNLQLQPHLLKSIKPYSQIQQNIQQQNFKALLDDVTPKIIEFNLLAEKQQRSIKSKVHITYIPNPQLKILIKNKELNYSYLWEVEKFKERLLLLKKSPQICKNSLDDPFFSPYIPLPIGICLIQAVTLSQQVSLTKQVQIQGQKRCLGNLEVFLECNSPFEEGNYFQFTIGFKNKDIKEMPFQIAYKFLKDWHIAGIIQNDKMIRKIHKMKLTYETQLNIMEGYILIEIRELKFGLDQSCKEWDSDQEEDQIEKRKSYCEIF